MADEQTIERLHAAATRLGRSFGALVREALDEKVASLAPVPRSLGHGDSHGDGPLAREIGEHEIAVDQWRSS